VLIKICVFVVVVLSGSGVLVDCIAFVFRVKLVFVVVVLCSSGVLVDCIAFVFRVKIATADDGTAVLRNVTCQVSQYHIPKDLNLQHVCLPVSMLPSVPFTQNV
jgi:hypothetical protein